MPPKKCLENIAILCFERRFAKQNSVIRLKSKLLAPPNFCADYAIVLTTLRTPMVLTYHEFKTVCLSSVQKRTHNGQSTPNVDL